MVKSVIKMMYKEVRGLHQAAYVLAVFAFGSQLLALIRDRMLANEFGAGMELDVYYAAFRIPDLLYVLFASTLSIYVLIPFVVSRIKDEDSSEAQNLLTQIFSLFLIGYTTLAIIIFILAPFVVPFLFPGLAEQSSQIVTVMRILLLQPLFLGISSLFGVITQIGHRFVLYAISPLVYNIGIIIGIVVLYPIFGLAGLAYGVVLGALGHMLVQLPLVRGSSLAFGVTFTFDWTLIRQVLSVSIPRALTLAMQQIVLLTLVGIASVMTVGSVAVFQFAYNLQSVPLAIIGASYSIAAFPLLADLYAQKKMEAFGFHITSALRHIIFWSVPVIGLIVVLRAQVVRVVLGSGAFDWGDTRLTAAVLAILCLSLFAQAINLLMTRVFYAGGFTKIPFLVTLCGSVVAIGGSLLLYGAYTGSVFAQSEIQAIMRLDGVLGSEVLMIAAGYSIAIILQTLLLLIIAVRFFALDMKWVPLHIFRSLLATIVGALFAYGALHFFVEGINEEKFIGIFLQGFMGGLAGLIGVIAAYYVTKSPELTEIYKTLRARKKSAPVITSKDTVL